MWSPVVASSDGSSVPCARNKHATALHGPHLYLFGGRNENMPLRDLWRYHIANNEWTRLEGIGDAPGSLQEHSMVCSGDNLYIFGGEVGFSNGLESPFWIYGILSNSWSKFKPLKGDLSPKGRRGHTATIYKGSMYIYGGYQDLKGSISELWSYHFESGLWTKFSPSPSPAPRHRHSAILHNSSLWIFGGMTNLEERSDFWRWEFESSSWIPVKSKSGPGRLHSHTAVKFLSVMILFGGQKGGETLNELWRFHFETEFWEKLTLSGGPNPRAQSTAFIFSVFQSSRGPIHTLSLSDSSEIFRHKHFHFTAPGLNLGRLSRPTSYSVFNNESSESLELLEHDIEKNSDTFGSSSSRCSTLSSAASDPLKSIQNKSFEFEMEALGSFANPNYEALEDILMPPTRQGRENNQLILWMYILGGREIGHITAFKRPLSIWKLDLTKTF